MKQAVLLETKESSILNDTDSVWSTSPPPLPRPHCRSSRERERARGIGFETSVVGFECKDEQEERGRS